MSRVSKKAQRKIERELRENMLRLEKAAKLLNAAHAEHEKARDAYMRGAQVFAAELGDDALRDAVDLYELQGKGK